MSSRRKMFGAIFIVIVGQCLSFNQAANAQSNSVVPAQSDETVLVFEVSKSELVLRGNVSSSAHGAILRQQALTLFPDKTATIDLTEKPAMPAGWALISELSLRAIGRTYSSSTVIRPDSITIDGLTGDHAEWQKSISRVQENLLPGMQLKQRVSAIGLPISHLELCERVISNATQNLDVEFARSSTILRSSAFPALDKLVQLMTDCPSLPIRIIGHTDSIGDADSNVAVSLARAQAVSAYMVDHGMPANRISVHGAGHAEPLDRTNSYRAHQINRRIEIKIVAPDD